MTSTFIKCAAALAFTAAMAGCSSAGGDAAAAADSDQALTTAGRIVTGQNLVFHGVTDDGYVIYATETGVSAVPLEGGTPIVIATSVATPTVVVSHDVVFVWSHASETVNLYPLTIWSHSLGQPTLLAAQSTPGTAAASPDSSSIVYIGDVNYKPLNWPGTLYGASLASLAKPSALLQDTDSVYEGGATIQLQFTADSSKLQTAYVVSSGSGEAVYGTFSTSTWAPGATIGGNVQYFATDASGSNVAVVVGDGVQVSTADGSTLSFSDIDTTNGVGFAFNDAARSFVYVSAREQAGVDLTFAENAPTALDQHRGEQHGGPLAGPEVGAGAHDEQRRHGRGVDRHRGRGHPGAGELRPRSRRPLHRRLEVRHRPGRHRQRDAERRHRHPGGAR